MYIRGSGSIPPVSPADVLLKETSRSAVPAHPQLIVRAMPSNSGVTSSGLPRSDCSPPNPYAAIPRCDGWVQTITYP